MTVSLTMYVILFYRRFNSHTHTQVAALCSHLKDREATSFTVLMEKGMNEIKI